jgi:hypothetical protein
MAANTFLAATGNELPDTFLVYQMISNPAIQQADDDETLRGYRVQVSYYSRTGLAGVPDIDGAMKTAGFTRLPGRELPYNEKTRHFGLALDYHFLEEI